MEITIIGRFSVLYKDDEDGEGWAIMGTGVGSDELWDWADTKREAIAMAKAMEADHAADEALMAQWEAEAEAEATAG
jgi:hypothetical protein